MLVTLTSLGSPCSFSLRVFIYNQPNSIAMAIALPVVAADAPLILTSDVALSTSHLHCISGLV